jgi:hypothetical protein
MSDSDTTLDRLTRNGLRYAAAARHGNKPDANILQQMKADAASLLDGGEMPEHGGLRLRAIIDQMNAADISLDQRWAASGFSFSITNMLEY